MMKQELHQLTKYLDLPQMNYLSYPPVTNHNIVGPAMSNNRGVHAHSWVIWARWRECRITEMYGKTKVF